ncbi:MAG: T9SS type A sorting domain-containing protein [Candidatus Marinimicrobia bacterium]|nr:T9SS type A sorting domain-containing protein [Candidatus Neomarinimicrobiota bacterium]
MISLISAPSAQKIIDGYTEKVSYYPGEISTVYLHADASGASTVYLEDIAKNKVAAVQINLRPQVIANHHPWKEGYGYEPTFSFRIPDLRSGLYFWEGKIPIIIKEDSSKSSSLPQVTVLVPTNTDMAYNNRGGKSLYHYNSTDNQKADTVSIHRPYMIQDRYLALMRVLWDDMIIDYSYIADIDLDEFGIIANSDLLLIIGHSEYWTRKARRNFDRHVDSGKPALVLSGNSMWWQIRYSPDLSQIVCHKLWEPDSTSADSLRTVLWTNPLLEYLTISSIGADFNYGGYGLKDDNGWDGFKLITTERPYLEGLNLYLGQIISLPSGEYDGTILSGFDDNGYPIPDTAALGFDHIEIIGYDFGYRFRETVGTWIEFQKTPDSGIIINVGSLDWCSNNGVGGTDGDLVTKITFNMIDYLLKSSPSNGNEPPFSGHEYPFKFFLFQNAPNPFNTQTKISFDLPAATNITLIVYDLTGREVTRLADGGYQAGYHQVVWDGKNASGQPLPSGIYIARLTTPGYTKSIKMVLLK